jgi:hypothetical protein
MKIKATNSAVADAVLRILQRRRNALAEEWQQLQNDAARWNNIHPDEKPIVIEPITAAEIEAMKNAR